MAERGRSARGEEEPGRSWLAGPCLEREGGREGVREGGKAARHWLVLACLMLVSSRWPCPGLPWCGMLLRGVAALCLAAAAAACSSCCCHEARHGLTAPGTATSGATDAAPGWIASRAGSACASLTTCTTARKSSCTGMTRRGIRSSWGGDSRPPTLIAKWPRYPISLAYPLAFLPPCTLLAPMGYERVLQCLFCRSRRRRACGGEGSVVGPERPQSQCSCVPTRQCVPAAGCACRCGRNDGRNT